MTGRPVSFRDIPPTFTVDMTKLFRSVDKDIGEDCRKLAAALGVPVYYKVIDPFPSEMVYISGVETLRSMAISVGMYVGTPEFAMMPISLEVEVDSHHRKLVLNGISKLYDYNLFEIGYLISLISDVKKMAERLVWAGVLRPLRPVLMTCYEDCSPFFTHVGYVFQGVEEGSPEIYVALPFHRSKTRTRICVAAAGDAYDFGGTIIEPIKNKWSKVGDKPEVEKLVTYSVMRNGAKGVSLCRAVIREGLQPIRSFVLQNLERLRRVVPEELLAEIVRP